MKFNKLCDMVLIGEKLGDIFFIQADIEKIRLVDAEKIEKLQKIAGITAMKQKYMDTVEAQKFLEGLLEYLSDGGTFDDASSKISYEGEGVSLSDLLSRIQFYLRDTLGAQEEMLGTYLSASKAERAADKIRKFLSINKLIKDAQSHLIKKSQEEEEEEAINRLSKDIESGEAEWGVNDVEDVISDISSPGLGDTSMGDI